MTDPGEASTAPEELIGTVEDRLVGAGSKSEMRAVVLHPDDPAEDAVVLRRREASALDAEPELLEYVGHRVRVIGTRAWSTFVVDRVVPADDDPDDDPYDDPDG